jgi:hypothetical protein
VFIYNLFLYHVAIVFQVIRFLLCSNFLQLYDPHCISNVGDSEPVKMFDRTANMGNNQIINYRCDPSEKWLVLVGIAPGAPEVCYYFC